MQGSKWGPDDYIVQTVLPRRELPRRASASILASDQCAKQRQQRSWRWSWISGDLKINTTSREVYLRDKPIALTVKEFDLLVFLANSPRRVFEAADSS